MADTKVSALTAATSLLLADEFPINEAGVSKKITGTLLAAGVRATALGGFSTATVAAGYAADTYLQGSAVTAVTGAWKAGTKYHLFFDITKTAAGVATPTLTLRLGNLGTTGDAAILVFTWTAGTAASDQGIIELRAHFRTVGAGTAAVMVGIAEIRHANSTTGLENASVDAMVPVISAGFDCTTQTIIGASFNGGASFSGTTNLVEAEVVNL